MSRVLFERLTLFVIIALPIVVLFIAYFADRCNHLGKFIFDFQALITGILAIYAAIATVVQMRRSDKQQQRRHNEQLLPSKAEAFYKVRNASKNLQPPLSKFISNADQFEILFKQYDQEKFSVSQEVNLIFVFNRLQALLQSTIDNNEHIYLTNDDSIIEKYQNLIDDMKLINNQITNRAINTNEIRNNHKRISYFIKINLPVIIGINLMCKELNTILDAWIDNKRTELFKNN